MDLGLHRRRRHQKVVPDGMKELYPHDLNMYKLPPVNEMPLMEFEDLALDRLKVLRILEFATHKGLKPFTTEYKQFVYEEMHKENLKKFLRLVKSNGANHPNELDYQARRADHISHFILRIAYCRSEELRRWFLNKEIDLFKLRFLELSPQSVRDFLEINKLQYDPISEEERERYRDELIESTGSFFVFDTTLYYKVPFTEVLNLVSSRRLFLKDGFAYVPGFQLVFCVATIFRAKLSEGLAFACKKLPYLDDERINHLLSNLHNIYTGNDYNEQANVGEININNLNKYSKTHFPPCMRHIHEVLKSKHHLKHGARLQYVLFLKAIGLSLDDCLQFWKEEFTKIMDGDKFDKQYAYSVKHSYGKVGRMQSYSAYSCMKIISNSVGPGENHGCPFKHWDSTHLKQKLNEYGMKSKDVDEISTIAEKGHYQVACGKYFECAHSEENKNIINHPNQYFEDSYKLLNETPTPIPKKIKTEKMEVDN